MQSEVIMKIVAGLQKQREEGGASPLKAPLRNSFAKLIVLSFLLHEIAFSFSFILVLSKCKNKYQILNFKQSCEAAVAAELRNLSAGDNGVLMSTLTPPSFSLHFHFYFLYFFLSFNPLLFLNNKILCSATKNFGGKANLVEQHSIYHLPTSQYSLHSYLSSYSFLCIFI